jgi:hypothetical protein
MGPWANRPLTNALAGVVVGVVGVCGAAYGIDSFLAATHVIGA